MHLRNPQRARRSRFKADAIGPRLALDLVRAGAADGGRWHFPANRRALWWRRRVVVAVLLTAAPLVVHDGYVRQVVSLGLLNAVLAMGVVLSYGQAGVPNMSQGTISGVGAYAAADVMMRLGLAFPLALAIAGICGALAGAALGATTKRVKGNYWWLITIAFTEVGYIIFNTWGPVTGGSAGLVGIPTATVGPVQITSFLSYYYLGLVVMAATYVLYSLIEGSRAGLAIRAVGRDELTAQGLGLSPAAVRMAAVTLAGMGAGFAGACLAAITGYLSADDFTLTLSFQTMLFAIVGGLTSLGGSIVAAVALTYLTTAVASLVNDQLLIIGGVVLAALFLRSYGIGLATIAERTARLLELGRTRGDPLVARTPLIEPSAGPSRPATGGVQASSTDSQSGSWVAAGDVKSAIDASGQTSPLLSCRGLGITFGGLSALADIDLSIAPGEVVGLIGPNGSGKTTLVNIVSGYYRPSTGEVSLGEESITGHSPQDIRRRGVSRVFQNVRLYGDMTVLDNLALGMLPGFASSWGVARSTLRGIFGRDAAQVARLRVAARDLLLSTGLGGLSDRRADELSYGQRKEVELLRAIAVPPRLLLLDEPTSGISDREAHFLKGRLLEWQAEFHFGTLVIEHRLGWLFDIASRVVVLNGGRVIASGSADEVATAPVVRSAYVGT